MLYTVPKLCQALFMRRWGWGGERKAQTSHLPYLAFPPPLPFLALLPFGLFWLQNVKHCYIISPISPDSQPFINRTLTSSFFLSCPLYPSCLLYLPQASCPPPCYSLLLPCPSSPCELWMHHTYFYSLLPITRTFKGNQKSLSYWELKENSQE